MNLPTVIRFPCSTLVYRNNGRNYLVSLSPFRVAHMTELLSASSKQMAAVPSLILFHCVFEETIVSAKSISLSH